MEANKPDRRKNNGGKRTNSGRKPKDPAIKATSYSCSLFPAEKTSVDKLFGSIPNAVRWAIANKH